MRIALKIAYIGTDYNGFQVQPDVKTIEGELFRALRELDVIDNPHSANYIAAGRTDSGVHALSQVIAFDTDSPHIAVPRAINSRLHGAIWSWAGAKVQNDFDPRRFAKYREYKYIISGKYNIPHLLDACDILMGKHDFHNFVTPEKNRSNICKIEKLMIRKAGEYTIIEIRSDHFLWHMVRKIATAMKMVGTGERDLNWLRKMMEPAEFKEGLKPAPAYGLILNNVEYDNMTWIEDKYAKKMMVKKLDEHFLRHSIMSQMFTELKEGLKIDGDDEKSFREKHADRI